MTIDCKQNIQSMSILIYKIAVNKNLNKKHSEYEYFVALFHDNKRQRQHRQQLKLKYHDDNYITKGLTKYSEYEYFDLLDRSQQKSR